MNLRRELDRGTRQLFLANSLLSALVLLGILLFLFLYGVRAFLPPRESHIASDQDSPTSDMFTDESEPPERAVTIWQFFLGKTWNPDAYGEPSYGILPLVIGSLLTTLIALVIAVPAGIASAVFIAERLRGWLQTTVKTVVELFAGFPSVVIGFFGLVVMAPLLARIAQVSSGLGLLTAGIVLGVMAMPTIITVSDDAIRVVPHSYREAAYSLGASRFTTAVRIVLPAARSGILAATMLGFGRAVGETMAVLMVAGNAPLIPRSLFDPVRTITSTIAIELGETAFNTPHFFSLFALGFVLFLIALFTNLLAELLLQRERRSLSL